jgi:hypothetical protein
MSVGARVLKWQILRAYAKVPQPPLRIYSDPGSGLVTVDGVVRRNDYLMSWPNIHDGPGTSAYPGDTAMGAGFRSSPWPGPNLWMILGRSIMTFDGGKIPPGAEIIKATYNFYIYQCYDFLNCLPRWALVTSNPVVPNNLVPFDYQNLGITPISTALDYAAGLGGTWKSLEILPAYLSLVQPGVIIKLGFRETKYDAPNLNPPYSNYQASGIDILTVDYVDPAKWPYLEVTYNL